MKITILYDNETLIEGVKADWGFSCLVEKEGQNLLFDTGANGYILLDNMRKLRIDPRIIDSVFISHDHWDHTGGLNDLTKVKAGLKVYDPDLSDEPFEFEEGLITTGALPDGVIKEQSLILRSAKGMVVLAGCSHPGLNRIIEIASGFGSIHAVIGGFHGFDRFDALRGIPLVLPCHCTKHKERIHDLYPGTALKCGAGKVIEI